MSCIKETARDVRPYRLLIAEIKAIKIGLGCKTVLLYSGWYCTPMYQGCPSSSSASTRPVSGLVPTHLKPASSKAVRY